MSFRVSLPPGWGATGELAFRRFELNQGFASNLLVKREPANERSAKAVMRAFRTEMIGLQLPKLRFGEENVCRAGQQEGLRLPFWHTIETLQFTRQQIFVVALGELFSFTFTDVSNGQEARAGEWESILAGVCW